MAVFCGDAIDGAVGSTIAGRTCGASTTLAATGPATAGASGVVAWSVSSGAGV
jgi:hypothetical protein